MSCDAEWLTTHIKFQQCVKTITPDTGTFQIGKYVEGSHFAKCLLQFPRPVTISRNPGCKLRASGPCPRLCFLLLAPSMEQEHPESCCLSNQKRNYQCLPRPFFGARLKRQRQRPSAVPRQAARPGPARNHGSQASGYGSKLNHQELDRKFWSMLPLTKAPFRVPILDPQPNKANTRLQVGGGGDREGSPMSNIGGLVILKHVKHHAGAHQRANVSGNFVSLASPWHRLGACKNTKYFPLKPWIGLVEHEQNRGRGGGGGGRGGL